MLYNAGFLYQRAGKLEDAARAYEKALAERPKFREALLNLGHSYRSLGRDEEAQAMWLKAVEAASPASGTGQPAIDRPQ